MDVTFQTTSALPYCPAQAQENMHYVMIAPTRVDGLPDRDPDVSMFSFPIPIPPSRRCTRTIPCLPVNAPADK